MPVRKTPELSKIKMLVSKLATWLAGLLCLLWKLPQKRWFSSKDAFLVRVVTPRRWTSRQGAVWLLNVPSALPSSQFLRFFMLFCGWPKTCRSSLDFFLLMDNTTHSPFKIESEPPLWAYLAAMVFSMFLPISAVRAVLSLWDRLDFLGPAAVLPFLFLTCMAVFFTSFVGFLNLFLPCAIAWCLPG